MKKFILFSFFLLSAANGFGFQSQFFQDDRGGFFRLDFSVDEFQGIMADALTVIPDSDKIFGVYKIDTGKIANIESQVPENQWQFVNGNKEVQKFKRWEESLNQESGKLISRRRLLESILEQEKKGEFALDPIERSNIETKISDLKTKEEPVLKRITEVRGNREELEMKLVSQFSDNRKKMFHEKPDFSVLGRFSKTGSSKLRFNNPRDGKTIKEITLTIPDASGGDPALVQQWLKAQGVGLDQLEANTPGDSVFSYLKIQSARRFSTDGKPFEGKKEDFSRDGSRSQTPDLYSILTGALAVQESLQLDRMIGSSDQTTPSIPIKRLTGPHFKSLPFTEMMVKRTPQTLPIDDLVPVEFYSCHFSDIHREIAFSDLLEQWGNSLLQTLKASAHDAQAKERYLRQLCLEMSDLARLFADKAITDLTICGADPFLHEGTDLSVIFSVKNRELFDLNTSRYFAKAKAAFPDCREENISFGNVDIHVLTNPDNTVRSFSCDLDQYKIYSNSRKAMELIIDTFQKKHPSVGHTSDYCYMRTIFPYDPAKEDFFLYLSDNHVRKMVGPVWKIAHQRRLQCVNSLRILQNAISLFGAERASGTPTLERLVQGNFVEPSYLFCPDGGTFSLTEKDAEPLCSLHGKLGYFAPILDNPPSLVTESEWDQYQKFVQDYNANWSRFSDPVGIRGLIPADGSQASASQGISLETCILPLMDNSYYETFRRFSAGSPVKMDLPTHAQTIVQVLCKLNLQDLRTWDQAFEKFIFNLTQKTSLTGGELVDSIGEALSINIVDSDLKLLVNLESAGPLLKTFIPSQGLMLLGDFLLSAINIPAYSVLSVRDEKKVERFIREWLRSLEQDSALVGRNPVNQGGNEIQSYETSSRPGGPPIYTLDLQLLVLRLHFFFVVNEGHLIIANQRKVIMDILAHPEIRTKAETNLAVRFLLKNFNLVSQTTRLYWQERMRAVCRNNLGSLFALHRFRGIQPADWWNQSLVVNGYAPFCPANGTYGIDSFRDTIKCSVHGDTFSPCQPFDLDMSVPVNKFVDSLKTIEGSLSFTSEGIMTRVLLDR
ncbi:MAG: hypothetical protein WA705_29980 [Candidatus Ozemobacteraceae bacterium]